MLSSPPNLEEHLRKMGPMLMSTSLKGLPMSTAILHPHIRSTQTCKQVAERRHAYVMKRSSLIPDDRGNVNWYSA